MTQNEIETILTRQREYYAAGHTLSYAARRGALRKLQDALRRHEADLSEALRQDLGKSAAESYMCEIGLTLSELSWTLRHLRGLMRRRTVPSFAAGGACPSIDPAGGAIPFLYLTFPRSGDIVPLSNWL